MSYDINYVRNQIQRIIDTAPSFVNTTRSGYENDGYGGRVKKEKVQVHTNLKCIFDNASMPDLVVNTSDAGRKFTQPSIRLLILWESNIDIKRGDQVEIQHSGRFYNVTAVNNILEQDLLLEVKLELRD